MKGKKKKLVKIDFNRPHTTYRLDDGTPVAGVTTALAEKNKKVLPLWGFNQGRQPLYKSLSEAAEKNKVDMEKISRKDLALWAFSVGAERKNATLYGKVDKAANIGTIAHEMLKARDLGYVIDSSNISPENYKAAARCVKSHDKWARDLPMENIFVEKSLTSKKYRYGGTLDKYCKIGDEPTLIDYKSGKDIYEDYFYQLAAYAKLLTINGYPVKRAICANFPKAEGDNFKVASVSISYLFRAGFFELFLGCLKIYYADQKIRNYKKESQEA